MLLCIDAGNTNIVFVLANEAGVFTHTWRIHTDDRRTADEYAAWLSPLFSVGGVAFHDVQSVIISSVVPAVDFNLSRLIEKFFKCPARFIGREVQHNLKVDLAPGARLGTDMAADCIAVRALNKLPAIVIDFGTATTFQLLNKDGVQVGGIIAPGINLSMKALYMGAAKLPQVGFARTERVVANDTASCMQSGVFWGYVSMVEGLLKRIEAEIGARPYVVATGGLAPLIAESLPRIDLVSHELTMRGIYLIHQQAEGL